MAVGRKRKRIHLRQKQLPAHSTRGYHPLLKEEYIARVAAEPFVLFEEGSSRRIVDIACHHIPRNRPAKIPRPRQELFGEDLKKRLLLDRCDGEFALGAIVPQPCSLAAGNKECTHFAVPKKLSAASFSFGVEFL